MSWRNWRRHATLEELDADHRDDFDVGSGSWDKGRGSAGRLAGGSKLDLPTLGGSAPAGPAREAPPERPPRHRLTHPVLGIVELVCESAACPVCTAIRELAGDTRPVKPTG